MVWKIDLLSERKKLQRKPTKKVVAGQKGTLDIQKADIEDLING